MRLSELLRGVKPLIFEDGLDEFEYSRGGTFFFARYGVRFYGITAKHCLRNRDMNAVRLLLPDAEAGKEIIPLRTVHTVDDPGQGEDWSDLALMELRDEELTERQRRANWIIPLDELEARAAGFCPGDLLVTRGFPYCLGGIEYDRKTIQQRSFSVDGFYDGPGVEQFNHVFRVSDMSKLEDPNGMSGAPVFKVKRLRTLYGYWFGGVVLRSTKESGVAHFLDASVVFSALRKAVRK